MVKIHELSLAITKQSLRKTSKSPRSSKSFFFHDAILYFSEGSQINKTRLPNHKSANTNVSSPIILILVVVPRSSHPTSAREPPPVSQGR
jgi:hypothetical protein